MTSRPITPTPSLLPSLPAQVWAVKELRSAIIWGYEDRTNGISWPWKARLVEELLTLSKESLSDVAAVIYAIPQAGVGYGSEPEDLHDYLNERGCALERIKLYTSFVRRLDITEDSLDRVNQAKLLLLYPNLHEIRVSVTQNRETYCIDMHRQPGDAGFQTLDATVLMHPLSGSWDVHSLYLDTPNNGSPDGKWRLRSFTVDLNSEDSQHESVGYESFYPGLNGAQSPWLRSLSLIGTSVTSSQLREILKVTPNLTFLAVCLADPSGPSLPIIDHYASLGFPTGLTGLHVYDPDEELRELFVPIIDKLLQLCPHLDDLEIPITFLPAKDQYGRMYIDGEPIRRPTSYNGPRWRFRCLTLKAGEQDRSIVSSLSLSYFFATAIPHTCEFSISCADSEGISPSDDDDFSDMGSIYRYAQKSEVRGRARELSRAVDGGRKEIWLELKGGMRKPGWAMLEKPVEGSVADAAEETKEGE